MKPMATIAALLIVSLLLVAGCGSSSMKTDTKTGSLKVEALFPGVSGGGSIGAARIDSSTARIRVDVIPASGVIFTPYTSANPYYGYYRLNGLRRAMLTATAPTTTISGLPLGKTLVLITTFDTNNSVLDQLLAGGEIVEGTNSLTATLLRGTWTFSSPIPLNKTMSSDTTQLTKLSLIAPAAMKRLYYFRNMTSLPSYFAQMQSPGTTDFAALPGGTLGGLFEGTFSNYTTGCRPPQGYWNYSSSTYQPVTGWNSSTMCGNQAYYENYFKGTTSVNGLDIEGIYLKPDSTYPRGIDPSDGNTNRRAFLFGLYSSPLRALFTSNNSTTFSDPTVLDALRTGGTRATAANTLSGTFIETLTKWYSSSRRCYDGQTEVICYQGMYKGAAKAEAARKRGILSRILQQRMLGIGAAAANAQGCYVDLQIVDQSEWTYPYSVYDPTNNTYRMTTITEREKWHERLDACLTSFTATGAQPSTTAQGIADQVGDWFFPNQQYY